MKKITGLIQIKDPVRRLWHTGDMGIRITRKIVRIDEEKCDGCGQCVPNCAEGALKIINGKARLVGENLCDGLGACLGHCPQDAIIIEERPAALFDEHAVEVHLRRQHPAPPPLPVAHHSHADGCPGSRMQMLQPPKPPRPTASGDRPSRLGQWPVQLALVPVAGPIWQDADVLIAADCIPFAYPDFHEKMLAGKTLAIACPKLDDIEPYIQKLTAIFANNTLRSITIAHMEVPCCGGIVHAVHIALNQSGRHDIPVQDITVGIDGTIRNIQ
jgi:NAD-dependent dihydropyrimidine dehydrogenase PreA subunit